MSTAAENISAALTAMNLPHDDHMINLAGKIENDPSLNAKAQALETAEANQDTTWFKNAWLHFSQDELAVLSEHALICYPAMEWATFRKFLKTVAQGKNKAIKARFGASGMNGASALLRKFKCIVTITDGFGLICLTNQKKCSIAMLLHTL
jgi:hypothetical protein